jgi:hypothetical protein
MVARKVLTERRTDLKRLREQCAVEKQVIQRHGETVTETNQDLKYDTKVLDRRITEMQNADMIIDSAIKQSNATTQIDLNVNLEALLAPMD